MKDPWILDLDREPARVRSRWLLELRRAAHELYLKQHHGPWWSLSIEGDEAVVRCGPRDGPGEFLAVRFPARALWQRDALSKLGF